MQKADVILLLGARLNWILHFGKPPRFSPDVKIIQVDICAEELDVNKTVALQGDIAATMQLFMVSLKSFILQVIFFRACNLSLIGILNMNVMVIQVVKFSSGGRGTKLGRFFA